MQLRPRLLAALLDRACFAGPAMSVVIGARSARAAGRIYGNNCVLATCLLAVSLARIGLVSAQHSNTVPLVVCAAHARLC